MQKRTTNKKMAREVSKTILRNRADAIVRAWCREKGHCEAKADGGCKRNFGLQWIHGRTRSIGSLRYDERNFMLACDHCHKMMHNNPFLHSQIWERVKGKEIATWLKKQEAQPSILTPKFYSDIIKKYEALYGR